MLDRLRDETVLEKEGWIRRGALQAPLEAALRGRWIPAQLWRLLVLEQWLEKRSKAHPRARAESPIPA
jgi:hypothetical protein